MIKPILGCSVYVAAEDNMQPPDLGVVVGYFDDAVTVELTDGRLVETGPQWLYPTAYTHYTSIYNPRIPLYIC
jgi:hypothetical protein